MTTESLEELRERLLRQQSVQRMIQVRAYEIYLMRGGKPGGESQDWFHAENEVLAFLIASESAQADEQAATQTAGVKSDPSPEAPAPKKPRTRAGSKPADAKQATAKTTAPKRTPSTKPAESKPKAKKTSKQSKRDESVE
jgi:DUF2934 family protein